MSLSRSVLNLGLDRKVKTGGAIENTRNRLLWAQALQELIERRYEQDLAEAIK